jgi:hypothetical protein
MTQEIIGEYMVTDGKSVLVKKTVVKKEVPPDLTVLKLLEQFYKMPDATELDLKGEQQ